MPINLLATLSQEYKFGTFADPTFGGYFSIFANKWMVVINYSYNHILSVLLEDVD